MPPNLPPLDRLPSAQTTKSVISGLLNTTNKWATMARTLAPTTKRLVTTTTKAPTTTPTTTTTTTTTSRAVLTSALSRATEKAAKLVSAMTPAAPTPHSFMTSQLHNTTVSMVTESFVSNMTVIPIQECRSPAYHEFPPDAFTPEQRSHGALILHILVVVYMFYALAIVCDDYFVSSLDSICEKLGMSEDVAGATFMAAGSSAPELFTSIIGVFVTKGDVGVGTIVGSAVFNILFVIGICGILVKQAVALTWYPVARDSIFYAIAVICLICVVFDGVVTWYESLIMLILYSLYIVIMRYNVKIRAIVTTKMKNLRFDDTNALVSNGSILQNIDMKRFQGDYEVFENDDDDDVFSETAAPKPPPPVRPPQPLKRNLSRIDEDVATNPMKLTFEEACFRFMMKRRFNSRTRFEAAVRLVISYRKRVLSDMTSERRHQFKAAGQRLSTISYSKSPRVNWFSRTYEIENYDQWKRYPAQSEGYVSMLKWAIALPISAAFYYSIPDCRKKRWERWFMATFIMSIVWIAALSYIMVWMVTLIGFTWSIPDSVMGITFLAAGTSIPDAMASVFVAKQGMGDMAVSNSIGSNVFDILLGLAIPWFFKTAIIDAGSTVIINSNGMVYSIILLFITIAIAVGAIHLSGWVLNKFVGIICMCVYAVYLTFSVMIECNVFGYVNAPMCKH